MKINIEAIPVSMQAPCMIMRAMPGYGGMTVSFNELPKGTDITPLLQGLEHNSCHCPHWGHIVKGSLLVKYDNGQEDLLQAGDVFYLPPGHTGIVQEDVKLLDFSPTREFNGVMEHIGKKMASMTE